MMTNDSPFSGPASECKANALHLTFTGDVHLGPAYIDERLFDADIRDACQRSDYVVVNVEGPITDSPPSRVPGFVLHSSPQSAEVLRAFGNNILNLANNHVLDHGVAGLRDTLRFATARGWRSLGAGEDYAGASAPCIIEGRGISVGIVSVSWLGVPFAGASTPGVFGDSPESRVRKQIHVLKRRTRWVVVVYHGGEEYTHIPLCTRRKKLLRYLSYGADVVVAHHAHCVQRYELVNGKCVFYGLGNMVFDLDFHRNYAGTDESVLLSLSFGKESFGFNTLFTLHDRERRRVFTVSSNPNFNQVTSRSYAEEWGVEASQRLKALWNGGHDNLLCNNMKQRAYYCWKKARRVAGLLYICALDKYGLNRPYIIGGVMHRLRVLLPR